MRRTKVEPAPASALLRRLRTNPSLQLQATERRCSLRLEGSQSLEDRRHGAALRKRQPRPPNPRPRPLRKAATRAVCLRRAHPPRHPPHHRQRQTLIPSIRSVRRSSVVAMMSTRVTRTSSETSPSEPPPAKTALPSVHISSEVIPSSRRLALALVTAPERPYLAPLLWRQAMAPQASLPRPSHTATIFT